MRELYINNQICDIDGEFNPTFQFKSFLFAKMQGYEAARTWEVSIPLTSRNRAIIQQSQAADSASTFPHTTHTVSYYSEGYPIVENGRAYMIGTGGGRARFVFVLGETIKALKELGEKKLNEMEEREETIFNWNRSSSFNDMSAGWGLCNWFNYTNQDRTLVAANDDIPSGVTHPSIKLTTILTIIENEFSIDLTDLSGDASLPDLAIPLLGTKGLNDPTVMQPIPLTPIVIGGSGALDDASFTLDANDYLELEVQDDGNRTYVFYPIVRDAESFDLLLTLRLDSAYKLYAKQIGGIERPEVITELPYINIGGDYPYSYDLTLYPIGVKPATRGISISFEVPVSFTEIWFENAGICEVIAGFKNAFYGETANGYYPIVSNLPDITCAEFVNQCCMLTGLFPYVDPATPSTVNFYSVANLYANKASAQNWSKYLIKESDYMSEGEDIEHALDGFSQRNTLNYAKDELNQLDTSGLITVNNTNIEYESELFRMFFAAGRRASATNAIVDYPLYDVSIKDGALIRNKTNQSLPIIGKIENVSSVNYLTFPDALKFSSIKTARYSEYQTLVGSPRILKEKFQLTPRLTAAIDVRIPVYLEQYGQYYAIMEAQVDGEYNADVTLLEI